MARRKVRPLPPQAYLQSVLEYREEKHIIKGYECPAGFVRRDGRSESREPGRTHLFVGSVMSKLGYMGFKVPDRPGVFSTHRLVWGYHHGDPGNMLVDHINGIPWDNRLSNLRLTTDSENQRNRRVARKDSRGSKYLGVTRNRNHWGAFIAEGGKPIYLGRFKDEREAAIVRDEAARRAGYDKANLNCVLFAEDFR